MATAIPLSFTSSLQKFKEICAIRSFQRSDRHERIMEGLNITDEMLNANSVTRQLTDQISLAKAFVVIAKESNNLQFAWELSAQIRNSQSLLSNAATRRTPLTTRESETAVRDMALLLYQAQQLHYDSATMIMRLKAKIQALEEQMSAVNEKSSKYGQIAAEEVPKSLYCLGVRLTTEWFGNINLQRNYERKQMEVKLIDNGLYHFCVFSDNILATSVVVNSTALNSKNPDVVVFHLVTDEINYAAMKAWFALNSFRGVTVEIQKFEDFTCRGDGRTPIKFRNPKYLYMLNHLRFYIPEVFPALKKVAFLDDDVVVQKDLSGLFSIDLNEPLSPAWHVLGLGYTNVDPQLIEKGAVLHFSGNSKIGMEKYKPLWEKYVTYNHPLLQQCNFH
ncbi:hypothetical protein Pint_30320 [Pistacia integerrima]|uniref:Uncharacterized protein n=1 Tax=Pistacia integerrima TaxID=434235 RepID=A0ACC0WXL7_9ROSI|nr:hypothetical protein Pint_30320 [Pistacia integerrima]